MLRGAEHNLERPPTRSNLNLTSSIEEFEQVKCKAGMPYENIRKDDSSITLNPEKESEFMEKVFNQDLHPSSLLYEGLTEKQIDTMIGEIIDEDGVYGRWMSEK